MSISSIECPSSTLRYVLLNVRPIPFEEIQKIKGIKFRVRGIRYEAEKQFDKIEDFVTFRYEQIFSRLPIPESLDMEQIFERIVNTTIRKIKEDKEIMAEMEKKETSLFKFVMLIKERFEKNLFDYYASEANRFLRSNLPLSFFVQTSAFIDTYQKYLSLVERIVKRYEILSSIKRRDQIRAREEQLNIMKKVLAPLIDRMDLFTTDMLSLKLYVIIWSAESIEETENPRFLNIEKLDHTYFQEYLKNYNIQLKNVRKVLFELSKNYDPELFRKEIMPDESAATMFSKILLSPNL